ncbi:MAG: hypothetical protein LBM75_00700 [Myxococcales bacterium]|jgi:hypothetical protein|nr:hypothetical protein [Myxococcales bacterium]
MPLPPDGGNKGDFTEEIALFLFLLAKIHELISLNNLAKKLQTGLIKTKCLRYIV